MKPPANPHLDLVVAADADDLAHRAADWMATQLAGLGHERLSVCLSGGSTPKRLYHCLARDPWRGAMPWNRLNWFWGDERVVPADDPRSNRLMAEEALLDRVPCPPGSRHPIPVDAASPEACAAAYQAELASFYDAPRLEPNRPLFDLVLLGIGSDGHTASLFPGKAAVEVEDRWVVAAEPGLEPFVPRITLTLPALAAGRAIAFLVSGADKTAALARIFAEEDLPAARLCRRARTLWFVDRAAIGEA
jgi:6-phosphogluconolactonase